MLSVLKDQKCPGANQHYHTIKPAERWNLLWTILIPNKLAKSFIKTVCPNSLSNLSRSKENFERQLLQKFGLLMHLWPWLKIKVIRSVQIIGDSHHTNFEDFFFKNVQIQVSVKVVLIFVFLFHKNHLSWNIFCEQWPRKTKLVWSSLN